MKIFFYKFFVDPLVFVLLNLYLILHDFGLAIIISIILLKIFLLPLSFLQFLEEKKIQKIKERINQETKKIKDLVKKLQIINKIYEEEKFNPIKNIFINLSVLPFYIGAILAIYEISKKISNTMFLNFINLLTPNIYFAFIVVFLNFYYVFKQPIENRKVILFFLGLISVIIFTLPSFLILYIFVSIILSFLERKIFNWYYVKFIIKSV